MWVIDTLAAKNKGYERHYVGVVRRLGSCASRCVNTVLGTDAGLYQSRTGN